MKRTLPLALIRVLLVLLGLFVWTVGAEAAEARQSERTRARTQSTRVQRRAPSKATKATRALPKPDRVRESSRARVQRATPLRVLASTSSASPEQLALLNDLAPGGEIPAGTLVKVVEGEDPSSP